MARFAFPSVAAEQTAALTPEQYRRLVDAGVLGKVEMLNGVVWIGDHRSAWSKAQIDAAREIGIDLVQ